MNASVQRKSASTRQLNTMRVSMESEKAASEFDLGNALRDGGSISGRSTQPSNVV